MAEKGSSICLGARAGGPDREWTCQTASLLLGRAHVNSTVRGLAGLCVSSSRLMD